MKCNVIAPTLTAGLFSGAANRRFSGPQDAGRGLGLTAQRRRDRFQEYRQDDSLGERKPSFEEIRVTPEGGISLIVRSKAFRNIASERVQSSDFGKTWQPAPP